jgi:glucokinase
MFMELKYAIGVDLGATKTLVIACDTKGQILVEKQEKTPTSEGKEIVIKNTLKMIENVRDSSVLKERLFLGIGIGYAGLINYDTGIVRSSIMLPDWFEVPLQEKIEKHFNTDARIDNDANAAAYGEWWIGAGRGAKTMICLTIGTGIGGGLIINNQLYRGPDGTAAEFGNMTIDYDGPLCWCGNRGCLNPLASGTAISQRTVERIQQGKQSRILELVNNNLDEITPSVVAKAAVEGDELAGQIIAETAMFLGAGIANLINALNPDAVVLSGGVAEIGELLINPIRQEVLKRAFAIPARRAKILKAELGNKAGAVGAAGILISSLT